MTDFPAPQSASDETARHGAFAARALDLLLEHDGAMALCGLSLDGRIRIWHDSAERLLGHFAADVLGRRLDHLAPAEHRHQGLVTRTLFAASAEGWAQLDLALISRAGQRKTCRLELRPQSDAAPGFAVLIREIGPEFDRPSRGPARRDPRAAHRANLTRIGGEPGWIGLGLEAEIEHISPLGAEYLGIVVADWIGRPLLDLLVPADADDWYALLHRTVEEDEPQQSLVFGAEPRASELCWPATVAALHDDDKALVGFTLALGSAAHAAERRTAPAADGEQSAERAWFHAVVHDMREPLRRVRGYIQTLHDGESAGLDARAIEYLARVDAAIARLQDNIGGVLRLARIDNAGLAVEPVDLKLQVEMALDDLGLLVHDHDARVAVGELGTVGGDPVQLRLLFQNLIDNSIRYRRHGVAPRIRIVRCDGDATTVRLRYSDNARGFADAETALAGRADAADGTGIGLDLCRRIARRHRGDLAIAETHSQGTTFVISLTCQSDDSSSDEAPDD